MGTGTSPGPHADARQTLGEEVSCPPGGGAVTRGQTETMHCFVSDLHLTEEAFAGSVTDQQLQSFVEQVAGLASPTQPIKLVFAGDILELLRSTKWGEVWRVHKSAPWSGMCPGFKNFRGGHSESCALSIAHGIQARYAGFAGLLKKHVQDGSITTEYIFGNHDYMVQLSPDIRDVLIDILSLGTDRERKFLATFDDQASSILATHGHCYDPINWHDEDLGLWAMGDAVVLRVVNRFVEEAVSKLGLTPETYLGKLVQDIENIESVVDIPLYVNWLAENCMAGRAEREEFRRVWKTVVTEFLAIKDFADQQRYADPQFKRLRQGFELSTHLQWADLIRRFADLFAGGGADYGSCARRLAESSERRFVIFGHTHEPTLVPVGRSDDEVAYYVNTGCWRRVVQRVTSGDSSFFAPRRLSSYFLVDSARDRDKPERYHLRTEWHAT